MSENVASKYIEEQSKIDKDFGYHVALLDEYDFSEFLTQDRSIWNIREAIEEKYDKEFWNRYKEYVFEGFDGLDTVMYFSSRYNVWFQEYTDWVVRQEDGRYGKTERRSKPWN